MTAQAQKRRPAGEAGRRDDEIKEERSAGYSGGSRKGRLTKLDAARLMSIWLDQVYDDDALPASAFKLSYRIAKRCRATFAKQGDLFSFEGQDRLAVSASISEKQVRNLLDKLAERGHLRVVRLGKKKTNRTYPVIGYRKSISDHTEGSDRQFSSGQNAEVIGNTVPSDRQSGSDMYGNGLPVHTKDEGVEGRVVDEGGEAPIAPPTLSFSNTETCRSDSDRWESPDPDALNGASGQDRKLKVDDEIDLGRFEMCVVENFGLRKGTRFVRTHRAHAPHVRVIAPVSPHGELEIESADFEDEFRFDEIQWDQVVECSMPLRPGGKTDAA